MNEPPKTTLEALRMEDGRPLLIAGPGEHVTFDNLAALPALWQRFRTHIGNVPGQIGRVAYGVCLDTDESGFDYIAGVEVEEDAALPGDYTRLPIAAAKYAVFSHTGPVSAVRDTFLAIFNGGLANAGHQAADAPLFERFDDRFDPLTGTGGFEIWIPVKT